MQLPNDLRSNLESQIASVALKDLVEAVRDLSLRYRDPHPGDRTDLVRSELEVMAYLAYRLPATYAVTAAVLSELQSRRPDLLPNSLLDFGAGPGTVAYAALQVWPDLEKITAFEGNPHMLQMGKNLAGGSGSSAIRNASWKHADLATPWECAPAQLTTTAYVLDELPRPARRDFLDRTWKSTAEACVLIEPGTPRGFETIKEAAVSLQSFGAYIVAPFALGWNCLEHPNDWCHFSQRVPRTPLQRRVKAAELAYEDEKYCYAIASRLPGTPIAARVIRHPQVRSRHLRLVLCTPHGVRHVVISRSQREAYRRAKKLVWGSPILPNEASLYGIPDV